MRGYASDLTSEIDNVIRDHPRSDDVWDGPAADDFYAARDDVRTRLGTLADDLNDHADALDARADEIDDEDGSGTG